MAKASDQPLQPNPFRTYRDPQTGLWVVVKSLTVTTNHSSAEESSLSEDSENSSSVNSLK